MFTNYTSGLVNYWPVLSGAGTPFDAINGGLLSATNKAYALDRFNNANGAMALRDSNGRFAQPRFEYLAPLDVDFERCVTALLSLRERKRGLVKCSVQNFESSDKESVLFREE